MAGGALATGLAPVVSLIILSTHFIRKKNTIRLIPFRLQPKLTGRIVANGGGASFVLELSAGIVIFAFNQVILGLAGGIWVSPHMVLSPIFL